MSNCCERLSKLYHLHPFEQDWGICNSDGQRVGEFIDIFLNHNAVNPWEWEELADLVFESANEALLENTLTQSQKALIISIVSNHHALFPNQLRYWLNIADENDYPVSKLIYHGLNENT